ncbi:hypothetical protein PF002_g7049 [Phytophthora fragariae]|uniref:Uncharacterized protein n=2 Tax=Phytophthora TaxID=4783 RepID=A0A6A3TNX0_9STRA|nr:hypothetical protein PF006_g24464 [Phytophthora fragariae]KAE9137859.1 hypothetical protein PF007_g1651 [Phytophthora fragariae]KAE9245841.1 hypothetical protein PF002_g7049 [Phytophthora fragariae]KAE9262640.1 hypothetical protein PR003_g33467 [Phytophthora rubi]KAE9328581.1 hypothetical protein PF001_g1314 [Phytophthora fragariae]
MKQVAALLRAEKPLVQLTQTPTAHVSYWSHHILLYVDVDPDICAVV